MLPVADEASLSTGAGSARGGDCVTAGGGSLVPANLSAGSIEATGTVSETDGRDGVDGGRPGTLAGAASTMETVAASGDAIDAALAATWRNRAGVASSGMGLVGAATLGGSLAGASETMNDASPDARTGCGAGTGSASLAGPDSERTLPTAGESSAVGMLDCMAITALKSATGRSALARASAATGAGNSRFLRLPNNINLPRLAPCGDSAAGRRACSRAIPHARHARGP